MQMCVSIGMHDMGHMASGGVYVCGHIAYHRKGDEHTHSTQHTQTQALDRQNSERALFARYNPILLLFKYRLIHFHLNNCEPIMNFAPDDFRRLIKQTPTVVVMVVVVVDTAESEIVARSPFASPN